MSHLVRGAWIEIEKRILLYVSSRSHLVRGAWIEIMILETKALVSLSHLVRGAWIEILMYKILNILHGVAPRKRCVD